MAERPRIPVVMYHGVDHPDPAWPWSDLVCEEMLFRRQIEALAAANFTAADLDAVTAQQAAGVRPRERRVVFTFDDGYLDNWAVALPLMRELGWRGTVYVNPEFVDPGETPRPTLDDVRAGSLARDVLPTRGFMNWAELRAADASGILEVASHSMSHTWYPTGPEIVDFHRPGGGYHPWLAWNARPDRKYAYLTEDQTAFVPWGTPVHEHGRSLGIRRYFPDPRVAERCTALVAREGGEEFFSRPDWRERLQREAADADTGAGRYETDAEMIRRFRYEIEESLRILSERLGRPVRHFCWPGGAYCDESWRIALEAGVTSLPVKRSDRRRWLADDPRFIRRISPHNAFVLRGRRYTTNDPRLLVAACRAELGEPLGRWRRTLVKLALVARGSRRAT